MKEVKQKIKFKNGLPLIPIKKFNIRETERFSQHNLFFICQLAHGGPIGRISRFTDLKQLYEEISECFDIPLEEILYCTIGTHKVDMSNLLECSIENGSLIFAHLRGRKKEVKVVKSNKRLGLAIADNAMGSCFIREIQSGGLIDELYSDIILVGDHIEGINNEKFGSIRHVDVARALRDIPLHSTFTIRLVEPLRHEYYSRLPRKTISRFQTENLGETGLSKINGIIESFLGFSDIDLAQRLWLLGCDVENVNDFIDKINSSELCEMEFGLDYLLDVWGVVTDVKSGRIEIE